MFHGALTYVCFTVHIKGNTLAQWAKTFRVDTLMSLKTRYSHVSDCKTRYSHALCYSVIHLRALLFSHIPRCRYNSAIPRLPSVSIPWCRLNCQ